MKFCPYCGGYNNNPNGNFCENCGATLKNVNNQMYNNQNNGDFLSRDENAFVFDSKEINTSTITVTESQITTVKIIFWAIPVIIVGLIAAGFVFGGMKKGADLLGAWVIWNAALAGIGAAFFFLSGYEQWSVTQSSVPGMGFNGIAATFLGGLDPIGTIFASYFIQHITSGGSYLDKNAYPSQISDFISAIIIYLCGFVLFFKFFLNSRIVNKKNNAEGGNK